MTPSRRGVTLRFLADVIRAEPGYFVMTIGPDAEDKKIKNFRTPVIAWALERGSYQPYPITLDGIVQGDFAVLLPTGVVECIGPGSGEQLTYATVSEWMAHEQKALTEAKGS